MTEVSRTRPKEAPTQDQDRRRLPASLSRNAPLVPMDSAGGQALAAVIPILTFLAALCAGGAELVAASSAPWRSDIAPGVTLHVGPNPQPSMEAGGGGAPALGRQTPGGQAARP